MFEFHITSPWSETIIFPKSFWGVSNMCKSEGPLCVSSLINNKAFLKIVSSVFVGDYRGTHDISYSRM